MNFLKIDQKISNNVYFTEQNALKKLTNQKLNKLGHWNIISLNNWLLSFFWGGHICYLCKFTFKIYSGFVDALCDLLKKNHLKIQGICHFLGTQNSIFSSTGSGRLGAYMTPNTLNRYNSKWTEHLFLTKHIRIYLIKGFYQRSVVLGDFFIYKNVQ